MVRLPLGWRRRELDAVRSENRVEDTVVPGEPVANVPPGTVVERQVDRIVTARSNHVVDPGRTVRSDGESVEYAVSDWTSWIASRRSIVQESDRDHRRSSYVPDCESDDTGDVSVREIRVATMIPMRVRGPSRWRARREYERHAFAGVESTEDGPRRPEREEGGRAKHTASVDHGTGGRYLTKGL